MSIKVKSAIKFLVLFIVMILLGNPIVRRIIPSTGTIFDVFSSGIILSSLLLFIGIIITNKSKDIKAILKYFVFSVIASIIIYLIGQLIKNGLSLHTSPIISGIISYFIMLVLWSLSFYIIAKNFNFTQFMSNMSKHIIAILIVCIIMAVISELQNYIYMVLYGYMDDTFKIFDILFKDNVIYDLSNFILISDTFVKCFIMFIMSLNLLKDNNDVI